MIPVTVCLVVEDWSMNSYCSIALVLFAMKNKVMVHTGILFVVESFKTSVKHLFLLNIVGTQHYERKHTEE